MQKIKMKRSICILLLLSVMSILTGCRDNPESAKTDEEDMISLCEKVDTLYADALWEYQNVEFEEYLLEQLSEYKSKALEFETAGRRNAKLEQCKVKNSYNVLKSEYLEDGGYYLELAVERTFSYGGISGTRVEFLVINDNGTLKVADWYDHRLDGPDVFVFGEEKVLSDSYIWENEEWVEQIIQKMDMQVSEL